MRIKTHYQTKENYEEMVKCIKDFIKENEEVILVNIGTDRCIGDAVAPIVGTMLKQNGCPIPIYGTIQNPIHAVNMNRRLSEIGHNHPNAKIIAIDACLGDKDDIGKIILRDCPLHPGKGVGKLLPSIGDISILGITDSSDNGEIFSSKDVRLDLVYKISSLIVDIIMEANNLLNKNIRFYNKNTYDNKEKMKEVAIN